METKTTLHVSVLIQAPAETIWTAFTDPSHITQWNQASPDWHCPKASNDIRPGGHFSWTMAAKDGSASFDFEGEYNEVDKPVLIRYTIADGRKVELKFRQEEGHTIVEEKFEAENIHSPELQQQGWQSILNSFKEYTESLYLSTPQPLNL